MKEKDFIKWSEIRKKGKWRFVLLHGVLLFGLIAGSLSEILNIVLEDKFTVTLLYQYEFYRDFIAAVIAFSIIGGPTYGILMWIFNEKMWKKEKEKR